jgi:hypothetical protein
MSRAIPKLRAFAVRLIAGEAKGKNASGTKKTAAFHVLEKLRPPLATLMGSTGVRGLILRALTLAGAENPCLRGVQVKADGALDGFGATESPEEMAEGSVILVAHLLGLLVAFIGENLTLRLLDEAWPELSLSDLDSEKGDRK